MVYIITYGCKVNYYESEQLASLLTNAGVSVEMIPDGAISKLSQDNFGMAQAGAGETGGRNIFILNSCAVTGMAEKKSRYGMAKIKKYHPEAKIYTMGCAFGKTPPKQIAREILGSAVTDTTVLHKREKAFIKVQDGCKNFCSFCIIPYIRREITARTPADVVREINAQDQFVEEIILCGINLCYYPKIAELVSAVDKCGRKWGLSSLEPPIITPDFVDTLAACKNFAPNFHICLQSGSDKVLADMNRHYTAADYKDKIALVRTAFPFAKIATDIIVGYPTETEKDFLETLELVKAVGFDKIHIFPFSPRAGTAAANLKPITNSTVTERFNRLSETFKKHLKKS